MFRVSSKFLYLKFPGDLCQSATVDHEVLYQVHHLVKTGDIYPDILDFTAFIDLSSLPGFEIPGTCSVPGVTPPVRGLITGAGVCASFLSAKSISGPKRTSFTSETDAAVFNASIPASLWMTSRIVPLNTPVLYRCPVRYTLDNCSKLLKILEKQHSPQVHVVDIFPEPD